MRCPNDSSELIVIERYGVDVHLCPICRHVWVADSDLDAVVAQAIAGTTVDDFDDEGDRKPRRRDKYSDDFDTAERSRKGRNRRSNRDLVEDYADY